MVLEFIDKSLACTGLNCFAGQACSLHSLAFGSFILASTYLGLC
jgi:hypothetical protein